MVSLLLASSEDPASMNLYDELLRLTDWNKPQEMAHGLVHNHAIYPVQILLLNGINHVLANNIDMIHEKEANVEIEEVLVLSKHVSKSQIPALTIHVIGLPGQAPFGEKGLSGGFNGRVVPPSPRFADLFRTLAIFAADRGIDSEFDITLETTHHGPFLSRPTAYLEIGSAKSHWTRRDAAEVWVMAISKCLGLDGNKPLGSWKGNGDVMLCLGGGHYAPRHQSIVSQTNLWLGHILANYSLVFDDAIEGKGSTGNWKNSVENSLKATVEAFPGGEIFAHLDRKSFKGWQRTALIEFLDERNIPVYRGKEILLLHKHKSSNDAPST
jgi:D-aminoacyl-tRNA deacylase